MKSEINTKNKVKFFGQYWGQEVFVNPFLGSVPVHNVYVFEYSDPEDIGREVLLLKPLSLISDEEMIELARTIGICQEHIDSGLRPDFREGLSEFLEEQMYPMLMVDFLRSRGYALPWMGISVEEQIEAGWIKLTES